MCEARSIPLQGQQIQWISEWRVTAFGTASPIARKCWERVRIQAESASEAGQLCSEFLSAFSQKNTIWAADKRQ